jgi:ATPase subunit of ABC transporter with duplicated ATPase domains
MSFNYSNISLSHLTFSYEGASEPLFEDASATFATGWTAVLGDNGIGKTTLIRIALGQLHVEKGTVTPTPGSYVTAYCPQETTEYPENLENFANDWSAETLQVRDALGIGDDWAWRYDTLSGGEKKRVQIACALALTPDVLVLDEPTNHVDSDTRHAIATAMNGFKGIGILISHDTELIDAVAQRCLFFERRHTSAGNRTVLTTKPGNYTEASAALNQSNLAQARELTNARRTASRIDSVKADRVHEAAQSAQKRRGDKIDPKDRDAFAKRGMAIYTGKDGRAGAASARIDSQVSAAHARVESLETAAKRYDGELFLGAAASHRRELVRLEAQKLAFDPAVIATGAANSAEETAIPGLTIPTLSVGPRDHIGVHGPNGTGKTTLITALHARLKNATEDEKIPYLFIPQETSEQDTEEALDRLRDLSAAQKAQVLSGIAQLNSDPDRILSGEALSPGELRKLLLCLGIVLDEPSLIIMDEPTNHLDLHSIEALGNALSNFPGALILVSHDERFLSSCTSITWKTAEITEEKHSTRLSVELR